MKNVGKVVSHVNKVPKVKLNVSSAKLELTSPNLYNASLVLNTVTNARMKKLVKNVHLDLGMIINKVFAIHAALNAHHALLKKEIRPISVHNAKLAIILTNRLVFNVKITVIPALLLLAIFAIMDFICIREYVKGVQCHVKLVKQEQTRLFNVKHAQLVLFWTLDKYVKSA